MHFVLGGRLKIVIVRSFVEAPKSAYMVPIRGIKTTHPIFQMICPFLVLLPPPIAAEGI
jgi:hypothetical protein